MKTFLLRITKKNIYIYLKLVLIDLILLYFFGDKICCILPFRICCLSETHSVQHFNQLRYARITTPKNEEKVIRLVQRVRSFIEILTVGPIVTPGLGPNILKIM